MSCNLSHGDLSHLQLYTHPVDILVALQGAQKGRPLQGLLVGSRSSEGDGITVTVYGSSWLCLMSP